VRALAEARPPAAPGLKRATFSGGLTLGSDTIRAAAEIAPASEDDIYIYIYIYIDR